MITLRPSTERGAMNHGWLQAQHTFSFADYFDPRWMGFHSLRVINEDRIAPDSGFGLHGHRDMEIISYVVSGAITHGDSMGNKRSISSSAVQYMSAGSGVRHSEMNADKTTPVHLLQIWIEPSETGLAPRYGETPITEAQKRAGFHLIAGPAGSGAPLELRQDAKLFVTILSPGQARSYTPSANRAQWVQVVKGAVNLNGQPLSAGDGAGVTDVEALKLEATESEAEFLLFDLVKT